MEQEQDMSQNPKHIINGFSFREGSAQLMAFALDVVRLGGKIEESFWTDHIVENLKELDLMDNLHITGPIIDRGQFDIFESLEQCRKNAHVLLDALMYSFDLMMEELRTSFCSEERVSQFIAHNKQNMFSRDLRGYLTRPVQESDLHLVHAYRRRAIALNDAEPVLLHIGGTDSHQWVWNGEWRALLGASEETRMRQFQTWYYNHAFTEHRLKALVNHYLHYKFPEHFNRG